MFKSEPRPLLAPEEPFHVIQCLAKSIDFFRRVVEIEAGPRTGGNAQPRVKRHCAVAAGADGDALAGEPLGHVVRMHPIHAEARDARLLWSWHRRLACV